MKCSAWIDPAVHQLQLLFASKYKNLFIWMSELSLDIFEDILSCQNTVLLYIEITETV